MFTVTASMGAFCGCAETFNDILSDFLDATQVEYGENDWNPNVDGVTGGGSSDGGFSGGTQDEPDDTLIPDNPDPEKLILKTETDGMGHKIAYYTDGSKEDLGRVVALDFTPQSPENKYGYRYFSTLSNGEALCALYNDLYNVALGFHNSKKNAVSVNGNYELADFKYSDYGLSQDEATGVWRTVAMEYPQFFWWSNSLLVGKMEMTMLADENYALASVRAQTQTAIEEIVKECDGYLDGTTSLAERALTIHDYIIGEMDYAYEADGITPEMELWAHNIAGIAVNKGGVCEAYAKTFDYLCGFFDLNTLTVVGEALQNGEQIGHAWNLLELDGEWYALDATWNDCSGQGVSREWWGMAETEFSQTHIPNTPADGWGVDYQFALPQISKNYLSPTRIYQTGETDSEMYATIEDALAVTETGKAYEVALYPDTAITENGLPIVERGAVLNEKEFTANGEITLVGNYSTYDGGYYTLSYLQAPNGLLLKTDLKLRDLSLWGKNLSLGACTLTAVGNAVEIYADSAITGSANSLFCSQTSGWTALGQVNLYELSAEGGECRLEAGGQVEYVKIRNGTFRLYGVSNVSLTSVWFASDEVRLYVDGATAQTQISIGAVTSGQTLSYLAKSVIYLVYASAETYPVLTVESLSSGGLYLILVGQGLHPALLGKTIANIGNISYSKITLGYSSGGNVQSVTSYFKKNTAGEIVTK